MDRKDKKSKVNDAAFFVLNNRLASILRVWQSRKLRWTENQQELH